MIIPVAAFSIFCLFLEHHHKIIGRHLMHSLQFKTGSPGDRHDIPLKVTNTP